MNLATSPWRRRTFIKGAAGLIAAPALMRSRFASAADKPIKIGFVSPQTGPLAFFGEPDSFAASRFASLFEKGIKGRPIQLLAKDSQSNPNRASELAAQLILKDEVNLIITAGAPETVIPVADQSELNGVPMIATSCPWESFVIGRGSTPEKGFDWTFLFAFGMEDIVSAYLSLWETIDTNKKVGLVFGNDADGNAWGDAKYGFPPALKKAGYEVFDTGRFTPMAEDYTAQITAMKSAGVDIVCGAMVPPEFFSFWTQAAQQGFKPKVATIAKTLLLPSTLDAIGPSGNGLSTEIAWHPTYPFKSDSTGESPSDLTKEWTKQTGKQWGQTIGLKHGLIDVAYDVVRRAENIGEPASVVEAIKSTDMQTVLGNIKWSGSPIKNVTKTPMVGGQWRQTDGKFDLVVCSNPTEDPIPVADRVKPLD